MKYFDLKFKKTDIFYNINPTLFNSVFELYNVIDIDDKTEDNKTNYLKLLIKKELRDIATTMTPCNSHIQKGVFARKVKDAGLWTFSGDNLKHIDRLKNELNEMYPHFNIDIIIEENKTYDRARKVL